MTIASSGDQREDRPSRREQILDAAAQLFATYGFHGVGIDEIGAAVGISGPALYRHFRSKDAMLGEMLTSISDHLYSGGRLRAGTAPRPQAGAALAALIHFHVDFALDHPALITVQERNLDNLPDLVRRRVRAKQREYVETWVRAIRASDPTVSEAAARTAAHAVFGLINSTPHSRYLNREQMVALLRRMAAAAIDAVAGAGITSSTEERR